MMAIACRSVIDTSADYSTVQLELELSCRRDRLGAALPMSPLTTDYRPMGLASSGCSLSSVVPQGDWSSNDSGQNRANPIHFGSLASNKRRLIYA
jgi:hypothetical protein